MYDTERSTPQVLLPWDSHSRCVMHCRRLVPARHARLIEICVCMALWVYSLSPPPHTHTQKKKPNLLYSLTCYLWDSRTCPSLLQTLQRTMQKHKVIRQWCSHKVFGPSTFSNMSLLCQMWPSHQGVFLDMHLGSEMWTGVGMSSLKLVARCGVRNTHSWMRGT
jgi:hypothetical protein